MDQAGSRKGSKTLRVVAGAVVLLNLAQLLGGLVLLRSSCGSEADNGMLLTFLAGIAFTVVGIVIIV